MDFIVHAIQTLFLFIDQMVYGAAMLVYGLLIDIANGTVFSQETIEAFGTRIYALLGIFMLFKVTFSMINYIVNPDDFSDKQKGTGKLVVNILTTLVLIVLMPRIFAEAMDLQRLIINENVLGRFVLGDTDNNIEYEGDKLAMRLFGTFAYYETFDPSTKDPEVSIVMSEDNNHFIYGSFSSAFTGKYGDYTAYEGIWEDTLTYWAVISMAAGVVLFLVILQFCFDVAIRTVKLGFLQIIAPIPIISRVDPKSSKDGPFGKWVKLCTKTYLDLFVRLLALYFAIYMISVFKLSDISSDGNPFAGAMIILGILLFAKQLPKLLEDLLGVKLGDGKFTLNPMKRLGETPIVGGLATAGITKAGGLATSGARFVKNKTYDNFLAKKGGKNADKHKLAYDNAGANFRLRNNAATVEALSRLKTSGVAGGDYKGQKAVDLYAAASTGDSSRKGGVAGIVDNVITGAYRNVQHSTVEPTDSAGVKSAKGIKATVSNTQNYMINSKNNINMDLQHLIDTNKYDTKKKIWSNEAQIDKLRAQLNADPSINYKNVAKDLAREYNKTVSKEKQVDADNLSDLKIDFSNWVAKRAQEAAAAAMEGKDSNFYSKEANHNLKFEEFNQALTQVSKAADDHLTKERKIQEGTLK